MGLHQFLIRRNTLLKVNFGGDLCLFKIDAENFSVDEKIKEIFSKADFNIANLESPLTNSEFKKPNQPIYLKGIPQNNSLLDLFDVFSLANNHILDYGVKGLQDTMEFLTSNKKYYFGAGLNEKESFEPLLVKKNNYKVAFLGFTRWNNATKKNPGTTPDKINKIVNIISSLREKGYFIVVYSHWNYEYVYYPTPDNREFGKKLIDSGADLIIGSHPHIIQGYEKYKGKYIFYSFGNFISHSEIFKPVSMIYNDPRLNITFILTVCIQDDYNYDFTITPVYTTDSELRILTGGERKKFDNLMTEISEKLANRKEYKKLFYREAGNIRKQTNKIFKRLVAEQGIKSLLIRLIRIKKQDIKVVFYSLFINKV